MGSAGGVARATIMALPKQGFEPGRPGPLEGVRVLDFSRLVAGNMLSLQLADFGAEVVKAFEDGSRAGRPPSTSTGGWSTSPSTSAPR